MPADWRWRARLWWQWHWWHSIGLVSFVKLASREGAKKKKVLIPRIEAPYLRYWNQIVAGVRCAETQDKRQPDARAEQTDFDLVLQIMRQVPCQNVEVKVRRDHCKLPVVTPRCEDGGQFPSESAESACLAAWLPASPLWRRLSRGAGLGTCTASAREGARSPAIGSSWAGPWYPAAGSLSPPAGNGADVRLATSAMKRPQQIQPV